MNERLVEEVRCLLGEDILEYAFPGLGDGCALYEDVLQEFIPEPFVDEQDPRTLEIISQLQAIKERYGLSDGDLDRLLGYTVRPSRLRISHSGRLFLEDFGGKEVRMDSLCKAVFFLFLKHPEGIDFKCLGDYREELGAFYYTYSGKEATETAERSLDLLCNSTLSNSIHEKVSRIKRAFENVVESRIASFYCITGKAGEPKRISLDRTLVVWE